MTTTKRIAIAALAGLAVIGASTPAAHAATFTVCPTGCAYSSIQTAVNAAAGSGNTIEVRTGTYTGNVTIPAGRDGLVLRGAQAGKAGDVAPRPVSGQESVLAGADGTALRVFSSRVTVDGFTVQGFPVGVWPDTTTSGLRVLNNVFTQSGNSVVPDSNGNDYTVVRHNAFVNNAVDRGLAPGNSIVTGASRGRLLVEDNRIAGAGALYFHYGQPARDVTVARNRAEAGSAWLAALYSVDGAVIQDNVSTGSGQLAYLSDTRDAAIYGNRFTGTVARDAVVLSSEVAPNRGTVIEGNSFGGPAGSQGVVAQPGSLAGAIAVRYNRFAPGTRGLYINAEGAVDARYNWWGCNEGPTNTDCARLDEPGAANVTRWPWLTLSVETDSERIENANGGTTGWRASVLRDTVGTLHRPLRFPSVSIVASAPAGTQFTTSILDFGLVGGALTAQAQPGVDLTVRADGETAATHVDFGPLPVAQPAPGPKGDTGAQGEQGPAGPAGAVAVTPSAAPAAAPRANECTASARSLSCTLGVVPPRGAKASLYRGARRVATGTVRVAGATVRVSVRRRVPAGRYDLVLTRGSRRLARLAVIVR